MKRSHGSTDRDYRSRSRSRVDIVPLIDVIFLLLAFFMFLTMSMVFQKGLPVDLVVAESGQSVPKEQSTVVLTIQEKGSVHWNKEKLTIDELDTRLGELGESDQDQQPRIYVNADEEANHGDVVQVLDLIRQHELDKVIFTVKSRP